MNANKIQASLKKLHEKIKSVKEISEEDLRVAFVRSGVLEELGYEGELKDIRFERGVGGKRSDLLAFDDYKNVVFVVEFKKPAESDLEQDFAQLWERYVKPLKARYGVLTDGLELLLYERINSNWERKLRVNLGEVTLSECEEIYDSLKKPRIERTRINEVLKYFERFDKPEERVNLSSEVAQQHFFESFELKEDSIFANLLQKTVGLFDFELERSKFLKSAYNFWKISYAKKPDKVPESWRRIMAEIGLEKNEKNEKSKKNEESEESKKNEESEENLFKFMFCLESAYSLFTRLILAKACEDYKLPYIEFSRFIKTEIERTSYRGDISLLAWAVTTKNLIEGMKRKLVKSVFEGDIFYWWEDSYRELRPGAALYSPRYEKQKGYFGEALAEIILTLYKFDFSEIVGDPLGTLYQRYFDKETRKALGEFYTPIEVVNYILDAVGYEGRSATEKRLLDPACGSGTFLVEALRRYLKASERVVEEKGGWSGILKTLCNEYCIAGFDIHPFATFMAQMQFMLVLIPAYKRAMEEDPRFVLNRLPIFRTDSLVDETKGEARRVTLESFETGVRYILIDTGLPVEGGNLKMKMPYDKDVFARTDLLNVQEYFAALQAVFDTVKESAWLGNYAVDKKELERNFKRYLEDKVWNGLVAFFTPYAEHFLLRFKELKEKFGDGKLIKSVEDLMLAAVLKNYVKYDFVVGNPPYVRVQRLPEKQRKYLKSLFVTAYRKFDIYVPFIERGVNWLSDHGHISYITSNKFIKREYGQKLRTFIYTQSNIKQIIDLTAVNIFAETTNDPCIFVLQKRAPQDQPTKEILYCIVLEGDKKILEKVSEQTSGNYYSNDQMSLFSIPQSQVMKKEWNFMPPQEQQIFQKLESSSTHKLGDLTEKISEGIVTGRNEVFFLTKQQAVSLELESEILRPLVRGENVRNWVISDSGEIAIYPYSISKEGVKPVDLSQYPNAEIYLRKHQDKLLKRKFYGKTPLQLRKEWFEVWNPINLDRPKIITPDISERNYFCLDVQVNFQFSCPDHTCFIIFPSEKIVDDLLYVLGLLNSKVIEFYHKHISVNLGKKGYRYITQYLKQLPIRLPQTKTEQALAAEITKKVEQILEKAKIEQQTENFPDRYIQEYRNRGEEFKSLNITFKSSHKTVKPVVEETIDGRGYNIVFGKKERSVFVESEAKANYVGAALKGKSAKKDEKKQILIPKSEAVVEAVLKNLEKDKAKTKSPSVADLEAEINGLVYRLYELNEEEEKVVEDFLEKF